jgi:hypothetical protein
MFFPGNRLEPALAGIRATILGELVTVEDLENIFQENGNIIS